MFRSKSILLALLSLLLVTTVASAQRGGVRSQPNGVEIQVRVTYPNEQPAPQQLRVELLNSSGTLVMETFTNDLGQADFRLTGSGNFRVRSREWASRPPFRSKCKLATRTVSSRYTCRCILQPIPSRTPKPSMEP